MRIKPQRNADQWAEEPKKSRQREQRLAARGEQKQENILRRDGVGVLPDRLAGGIGGPQARQDNE